MSKSLGFWRTWALVVGTMIGSGIFLLPAVLAPHGAFSLVGWIVAGTGTLFIALMLGTLARRIPKIGGPYAYTRVAFGDLPAFLIAWGYWICVWAGSAAMAVAFSGYMSVFLPSIATAPIAGAVSALIILWIFTAINLGGVGNVGIVQLVTTLLKMLPLFIVAAGGLFAGEVASITPANPQNEPLLLHIAGVALLTMWAFVGMEAATIPADDVVAPERTIPRALLTGTLTATAVYIFATLGVMALVPAAELAQSSAPFADAAFRLFGSLGAGLIGVGALVSIGGALNSNILLSGQMPRAAALDNLFPARFGDLNKNEVPEFSLVVSSCLSSALIIMNYSKGLVAAFTTMILLSTLMTLVPYAVSAVAELQLQKRQKTAGGSVKISSIVIAGLALFFSVFAIIGSGAEVVIYGALLLVLGMPVYLFVRRKSRNV